MKPIVIAAVAALFAAGCAPVPQSASAYKLIPGTFEPGRQPDGNSIILDAPDGLIVIDTGRHAAHQEKILAAARERGKPIAAIINSHWHLDHSGGNQELRAVFPNAEIIASTAIEGALTGFLAASRKDAEAFLASGQAPPEQAAEIRGDFAAMDHPDDLRPTQPVTARGVRKVAGRTLDLRLARHAATAGDVWVYDPQSRTLFSGDLVVAFAPFLDTACVTGWLAALDEIAAVPFTALVPGHGLPMTRAEFGQWKSAFRNLVDCAAGEASDADCIAGWNRDAAPFVAQVAPRQVDGMIAYYLKSRLRAEPSERTRYCAP